VGLGSAVVLTTTAETLIAYSGPVRINNQTMRIIIKAWLQLVISATSTGLILRIRRGNGVSGAVVAGGNTQTITASTTDDFRIEFTEQVSNAEFVDYSLTAAVVAASANSTANLATITAESING
jgi:hypothetical protein